MARVTPADDTEAMFKNSPKENTVSDIYDDLRADIAQRYGSGKDAFQLRKERIDREHAAVTARARFEQTPEGTLSLAMSDIEADLAFEAEVNTLLR